MPETATKLKLFAPLLRSVRDQAKLAQSDKCVLFRYQKCSRKIAHHGIEYMGILLEYVVLMNTVGVTFSNKMPSECTPRHQQCCRPTVGLNFPPT